MEIDEEMTMEEIEARFDREWVLINDPVLDEQYHVVKGRVRFHSPDRDELDNAVGRLRTDTIATFFIGAPPDGMQFLL